jgi:diguanylate cyclase (GGDEF)-like protein
MGIGFGQGYFIARPNPTPLTLPSAETQYVLNACERSRLAKSELDYSSQKTAFQLLSYIEPALPTTANDIIFERFSSNPALRIIPVVKSGKPLGIINRYCFIEHFAKAAQREVHAKQSCVELTQAAPLLVDRSMPIAELSHFLAEADSRHFADGFIITENERYIGVASGQDLLRELTQMQLEAARYANPLTLLPGNVPINQHIERLLQMDTPFVACYCDLDNFKPYNDTYSYRKGDEMIQLTGRILNWACDPKLDFIGHIGGDDFVLIMQSRDWRARCERALHSFEQAASLLFEASHLTAGGYSSEGRDGLIKHYPLTTLSIGALPVTPRHFASHHDVSSAMTEAKKMAKRISGNSLFIEQRNFSPKTGASVQ